MGMIMDFLYSLHFHPVVFVVQAALFAGFHFLMKSIIYEPLMAARNQRDGRIQGGLERAEAAAANAQALKARYVDEMATQRHQLAAELKTATEAAEKEAAVKLQAARDEAGRIVEEANARLNEEQTRLKAGMDDQAGRLALTIAEKVVRNSLAPDAQERVLAGLKG